MKRKVFQNAAAQFLGKAMTIITSFVIVKAVSSMGKEFYGDYITAYEFLAFFGVIADAGLFAIAVREMTKAPAKTKHILSNIFSMRLTLLILIVLIAGLSAQLVPTYSPLVKTGIWITALSMALTIVAGTLSSVLQARMKIHFFSGSLVLGKVLLALLTFVLVYHSGLTGGSLFFSLLWAGVISNVLFCTLVWFFTSREVPIRLGLDFPWWRKIFSVSLPYGLALILQTLYLRIDVVLISILLGSAAVGTYGVTTRILESFLILGVFFGQAILPKISAEEAHPEKIDKTLGWGIEILFCLALPIIIGITAFAPETIRFLSSEEFLSSAGSIGSDTILMLLIPTILFAYLNQLFTFTLVAKNRQTYLMLVNGIALGLNAGLNVLLLPTFGIIAAAWTTVGCEIVVFLLLLREIGKHFRIRFHILNWEAIILANGVLAGLVYLTPLGQSLILAAALGSFAYFGVLFLFRDSLLPAGE